MNLTKEGLRARFAELTAQADAIRATSGPLRAARDTAVNEARAAEVAMNTQITTAEAGLFEIEQERAMIVRALAGKTEGPEAVAARQAEAAAAKKAK